MRPYAKISPRLWTGRLGLAIRGHPHLQALAPYLASSPHTNFTGLYHLPLAYAASDLGWTINKVHAGIRELVRLDYCQHDPTTDRIWVIEYLRHEMAGKELVETDKRMGGAQNILADHTCSPLAKALAEFYGIPFEAPSKPLRSPSEASEQEQEQDMEQEQEKEAAFSFFWQAYPRKVGKGAAETAWKRANGKPALEAILRALELVKATKQWQEGVIPNPSTWINQKRWEDEPTDFQPAQPGSDDERRKQLAKLD